MVGKYRSCEVLMAAGGDTESKQGIAPGKTIAKYELGVSGQF